MSEQVIVTPESNPPMKPLFSGLGHTGFRPRPVNKARHLVMGFRKSGKSSFICSAPSICVLDWEGGCGSVVGSRAFVVNLSSSRLVDPSDPGYAEEKRWASAAPLERYEAVKKALLQDASSSSPQFQMIGIDTFDFMAERFIETFCKENNIEHLSEFDSFGAGYRRVADRVFRELQEFEDAGYGLVVGLHLVERTEKRGNDSYTVVRPRPSETFRTPLLMKVDQVMAIEGVMVSSRPKKKVVHNGQTILMDDTSKPVEHAYKVTLHTVSLDNSPERGCRVEIPTGLSLPRFKAWDVYAQAYNDSVARGRASS